MGECVTLELGEYVFRYNGSLTVNVFVVTFEPSFSSNYRRTDSREIDVFTLADPLVTLEDFKRVCRGHLEYLEGAEY